MPAALAETSIIDATTFALEKRVYPTGDLLPGQPITYTLRYTNTGSLLVAPLTITDTVPVELTDVSFSAYPSITDTLATPF